MDFTDAFWVRLKAQGIAPVPGWSPTVFTFSEELYYEPDLPDGPENQINVDGKRNSHSHRPRKADGDDTSSRKTGNTTCDQSILKPSTSHRSDKARTEDGDDANEHEHEDDVTNNFDLEEGEFAITSSCIKTDAWSGQIRALRELLAIERHDLLKKLTDIHTTQTRKYAQKLALARGKTSTFTGTLSTLTTSLPVSLPAPSAFDRRRAEAFMFLSGSILSGHDASSTLTAGGANPSLTFGHQSHVPFVQTSPPAGLTQTHSMHATARKSLVHRKEREEALRNRAKEFSQTLLHAGGDIVEARKYHEGLASATTLLTTRVPGTRSQPSTANASPNQILRSRGFIESFFKDLDLRRCNIANLDSGLSRLTKLQHLDVSYNQLTKLDFTVLPTTLLSLKVNHNAICDNTSAPKSLDFATLYDAPDWSFLPTMHPTPTTPVRQPPSDMEADPEIHVPSSAKLAYLSVAFNRLKSLTSLLPVAKDLIYLDVSYNLLDNTDECLILLENFTNLKYLYISGNPVCSTPSFSLRLQQLFSDGTQQCVIEARPPALPTSIPVELSDLESKDMGSLPDSLTSTGVDRLAKYDSLPDLGVEGEADAALLMNTLGIAIGKSGVPSSQQGSPPAQPETIGSSQHPPHHSSHHGNMGSKSYRGSTRTLPTAGAGHVPNITAGGISSAGSSNSLDSGSTGATTVNSAKTPKKPR